MLDDHYESIITIHFLLMDIRRVCFIDEDELNDGDRIFRQHVKKNLVISHGKYYTLPTPVFSYTKLSSGVQFLLHILLSMGSFDTKIDLTLHETLRESLRYAKLIGPSNEPDDLTRYSNDLMLKYFKEQIVTFPNSKYVLQSWIVQAADIFDSIIIDNELRTTDLPTVQQSEIFKVINDIIHHF